MKLVTNDDPLYRGLRTALSAFGGWLIGLLVVIWNTPGVPENVITYIKPLEVQIFLLIGVPTVFGAGALDYLFHVWRNKTPVNPVSEAQPLAELPQSTE